MINFEVKLSLLSCQVLLCCIAYNKELYKQRNKKLNRDQKRELWAKYVPLYMQSHFIVHARALFREKLLEQNDEWIVTERGYKVADLILDDIKDLSALMKQLPKTGFSKTDQLLVPRHFNELWRESQERKRKAKQL